MKRKLLVMFSVLLLAALIYTVAAASPIGRLTKTIRAQTVTLVPDLPSGQQVGTEVNWTVTVSGPDPHDFRFMAGRVGEPLNIIYDFRPENVFEWAPMKEGTYIIVASARNKVTGGQTWVGQIFTITPLAVLQPVVATTRHPLVAHYAAPACVAGNSMRVIFVRANSSVVASTPFQECNGTETMNFYVAGLRAQKLYWMIHQIVNSQGQTVTFGPLRSFATGQLGVAPPPSVPEIAPNAETSLLDKILFLGPVIGSDTYDNFPYATDLFGRVVWYYDRDIDRNPSMFRPVPGGTATIQLDGERDGQSYAWQVIREVDLAGHTVRETNAERVNEQVMAMGHSDIVGSLHHEAVRLPDGKTAVLASNERWIDFPGRGLENVTGDYVVVLDENFQVVWVWNGFDHLDPFREAVMGEVCASEGPGCPPFFQDTIANDWMHSNSITLTPDGDFIVSMRHQDWVIKINYDNGAGDGSIDWRLGEDGDFTISDPDPWPWQTHQHDARYVSADEIALYDNGNTRCTMDPNLCYSRGQVYQIDENTMTASLVLNADLGNYSFAVSSSQKLSNGNYHFDSGIQVVGPDFFATGDEIKPDGTINYSMFTPMAVYRSYRMVDMYTEAPYSPAVTELVHPLEAAGSQ